MTPASATQSYNEARRPLRTIHHRKLPYAATASKKWLLRPHKPIHSPRFTSFPTEFSRETPNTTISFPLRPIFPVWRARYLNFICTSRMHMKSLRFFSFFFSLYRRINSAPFSMRHRNTTHPPPTTRGQKKALALYFMYQIRKKKWSFSTPPFLWPLIQRPQNCPQKKVIHRISGRKCL